MVARKSTRLHVMKWQFLDRVGEHSFHLSATYVNTWTVLSTVLGSNISLLTKIRQLCEVCTITRHSHDDAIGRKSKCKAVPNSRTPQGGDGLSGAESFMKWKWRGAKFREDHISARHRLMRSARYTYWHVQSDISDWRREFWQWFFAWILKFLWQKSSSSTFVDLWEACPLNNFSKQTSQIHLYEE